MAIGFSFVAACRWQPRYDFGDFANMTFAKPRMSCLNDPLFVSDTDAISFARPSMEMRSVFVPLGSIGTDTDSISFPVPGVSLVNVLKPQGSIATDNDAMAFGVPSVGMKDVLRPQGTIASDADAITFPKPTLFLAP